MDPNESQFVGKFLTEIILAEYLHYKSNDQGTHYGDCCCYIKCIYGIP